MTYLVNTPEHAHALPLDSIDVVLFGVPRSGSCVTYQVVRRLYPQVNIIRTHLLLHPLSHTRVLCTVRDLRDCVVSHWRFRVLPADTLPTACPVSPDAIRCIVGFYEMMAYVVQQYRERYQATLIRYEDWAPDAGHLGTLIMQACPDWQPAPKWRASSQRIDAATLRDEYAMTRNRATERYGGLFEPGHIHEGRMGQWSEWTEPKTGDMLTRYLRSALDNLGYV